MAKIKQTSKTVYQLKITLEDIKPPIWRRVVVADDIRLNKLHEVFQDVMGWTDTHLHQFKINGEYYGIPDSEFGDDLDMFSEKKYCLKELIKNEGEKFIYEYDFGDGWEHKIKIEAIRARREGEKTPYCLSGQRACPPEDCGGAWGYQELLETLKNPESEKAQEMKEWLGRDYDAEEFDVQEINEVLGMIKK